MGKHLIEDPAIRRQLHELLSDFENRMHFLGAGDYHGWDAGDLTAMLTGRADLRVGPSAAVNMIIKGLLHPSDLTSPGFWGSPLGRALAFWGDGDPSMIDRSCAAAALDCTRANLSLMVRSGRLSEVDESVRGKSMITTASLTHAMRIKYPLSDDFRALSKRNRTLLATGMDIL